MLFRRWVALLCALLCLSVSTALAGEDGLNVLLIGVDQSEPGTRGRSDTMMLVRVQPEDGSIRLVSFLRDLYIPIAGVGKTRLNAAYTYGGEALLKDTLAQHFGVRIDRTVTVGFSLLAELIDQVGGVEIEIEERERKALNAMIQEYNGDYGLSGGEVAEAGVQRLDGRQALCYSRLRKIDSDFQRTSRQQAVVEGLLRQISAMGKWDLLRLAVQVLGRVETDLTFGDVTSLVPLLTKGEALTLQTARVPFDGAYREETIKGMMVLVPDVQSCRTRLQRFLSEN